MTLNVSNPFGGAVSDENVKYLPFGAIRLRKEERKKNVESQVQRQAYNIFWRIKLFTSSKCRFIFIAMNIF